MFDHRNFAVHGLYPGLVSIRSIANLGQFDIEIIIEPEVPSLGGSAGSSAYVKPSKTKYTLKIRVNRKDKTWEYESKISQTTAKVIAKFLKQELPSVELINANVVEKEQPAVEVKHVSTTKVR